MASIRFITAPIGGGKSLFGTINVCNELEKTDRFIVTNLPLVLEIASNPHRVLSLAEMVQAGKNVSPYLKEQFWTIQEYCHAFIKRPINVAERLVVLDEERTKEFWRYIPRGGIDEETAKIFGCEPFRIESDDGPSYGYVLPNVPHKQFNFVPDFTFRQKNPRGVYYVLDEVHQHFPARFWQSLGPQAERYMSQLRKLNDDLDLLTQHPEKVDKNFRRNATDWLHVENMSKKKLFMGVSINNRFRWHWYNQAEMPTRYEKPTSSGWYSLEAKKRHQWLYRTTKGVGVAGGTVAEDNRYKGRSPLVWAGAVILALVLAYAVPRLVTGFVATAVGSTVKGFQHGFEKGMTNVNLGYASSLTKSNPVVTHQPAPTATNFAGAVVPEVHVRVQPAPRPTASPAPDGLYSTGYVYIGTNVWVFLSDGTTAKSEYGEVQGVGERYVRVLGYEKIPVHK